METQFDRILVFLRLSVATCVVYDHATTLDEEVELIWKRPKWTAVQFLFFTNRYVGDIMQIYIACMWARYAAAGSCPSDLSVSFVVGIFSTTVLGAMQGIMIYRVCSMYDNNRKITTLMFTAFFLECVSIIVIGSLALFLKSQTPDYGPTAGVFQCSAFSFPHWMYTIWIPIGCFDVLLLGVCLSPAIKYYRFQTLRPESTPLSRWYNTESLTYILLRDSITFPSILLAICIVNFLTFFYLPLFSSAIGFSIASFAPCIIGPRLILNLRETYYQPFVRECSDQPDSEERDRTEGGTVNELNLISVPTS